MNDAREESRAVVLEGAYNVRDLGGLPAGGGRVTRRGVLFRGDSLHLATEADVGRILDDLGVRRLIDLRSAVEAQDEPAAVLVERGVEVVALPLERGAGRALVAGTPGARLVGRYLEYVDDHVDSIVAALRLMGDGVPTLFHCRMGKDRTGVVAALLLAILGVAEDDIVADYVLTNEAVPSLLGVMRENPLYAANLERLPAEMYTSWDTTVRGFLQALRQRHGSVRSWALSVGLSDDDLDRLREVATRAAALPDTDEGDVA